jgi:putative ABC transport system permease protein
VSILTDLRWAARQFRRRPGIALIIVLSLGSAMGISSSLFSVVNAAWFKPWPVPDAGRLRVIAARVSADEWRSWPRQSRTFSGLAAERSGEFTRLGGQVLRTRLVSANYFQVLRVPMALGRTLKSDDASDAAVISYELWQRRFRTDPDIVGRSIVLDSVPNPLETEHVTVIGVAAEEFSGTDLTRTHLWRPLSDARRPPSGPAPAVSVFGRLALGVSDEQAEAELSVLRSRYSTQEGSPAAVKLLRTDRYSQSPPSVETGLRWAGLLAGLVFITLIACANVSNLMLASGYARRGEVALRLALGGRRGGIIRQLLIESFLLSLAAGSLGVAISSWLPDALLGGLLNQSGVRFELAVDGRVIGWSLAVSILACVVFGLAPALRSTDLALGEALKESQDNSRRALMPSLLSSQTIVSVMAIVVAALMLRSAPVAEARRISRSLADLSVVRLDPPRGLHVAERQAFVAAMTERLSTVAGGSGIAGMAELQWRPEVSQSLHVTAAYFNVLRIPLLAGRIFVPSDPAGGVVVVNEAFARRFWPDREALGQTLSRDDDRIQDSTLMGRQVVGVVANAQLSSPTAYVPANTADVRVLLVPAARDRTAREAAAMTSRLSWPVAVEVVSGSDWVSPVVGPALFAAWITTGFGTAALLLGVVGFFSLLEYSVQQRTREIGIRRALGAGTANIVRSLVGPAALPLMRGLAIGSAGAGCLAEFMRRAGLPAGINPLDPLAYVAVAGLMAVTAAVASYAPSRRALRIEPIKALRVD